MIHTGKLSGSYFLYSEVLMIHTGKLSGSYFLYSEVLMINTGKLSGSYFLSQRSIGGKDCNSVKRTII